MIGIIVAARRLWNFDLNVDYRKRVDFYGQSGQRGQRDDKTAAF